MMILDDAKYTFDEKNVDNAPKQHGVYLLYADDQLIYVGRASGFGVSINSRLYSHLKGREGLRTKNATHYQRQVSSDPEKLEREVLIRCRKVFGRMQKRSNSNG